MATLLADGWGASSSPRLQITLSDLQEHQFVEHCVKNPPGIWDRSSGANRYSYPFSALPVPSSSFLLHYKKCPFWKVLTCGMQLPPRAMLWILWWKDRKTTAGHDKNLFSFLNPYNYNSPKIRELKSCNCRSRPPRDSPWYRWPSYRDVALPVLPVLHGCSLDPKAAQRSWF